MSGVRWKVFQTLKDVYGANITVLRDESTFREDIATDSLEDVTIVFELEKRFGIEFEENELEDIVTVRDLIHLIEKKIQF